MSRAASNMAKFVIGDDGAASVSAADSSDKVGLPPLLVLNEFK